jgi:hypothetical protein
MHSQKYRNQSPLRPLPRFPNRKSVIDYLGSAKLLKLLQQDYGLKPIIKSHKMTCYSAKHVEDACIMLEKGIALSDLAINRENMNDQAA